jgi:dolichol-phosphate mannosyltransferase
MKKALVIIPTYNEVENVKLVFEKTFSLKRFDVLVVDDSSPDGTAAAVNQLMPKYPKKLFLEVRRDKEGLGKAYIYGFEWA